MQAAILDAIQNRRSIREFTGEPVGVEQLHEIVTAGTWAPSGLNNQPWRFKLVVEAPTRAALARQTTYGHVILAAPALIVVYLDGEAMYDPVKDHQAAGACIQNMLLAIEALGLGGVWLGQILKNKAQVNHILELSDRFELMAVVAVGHPRHREQRSTRKPLAYFLL